MIEKMNGSCYVNMLDYGVRNLNKYCQLVNQLNVFPIPDGDTGTNMVTTIAKGLNSIENLSSDLPSISKKFANSVIYGARGNSGVIVSQFLKGVSEVFSYSEDVDSELFIKALEHGTECAYNSVSTPVEGTMLTVIKDGTLAAKNYSNPNSTINEIIDIFIKYAKISLENTPELLSTLKEAGVVDSGGAGIIYFFEGMQKYLKGEQLEDIEIEDISKTVDFSAFNRDSVFEYGYCTELLIQLLNSKEPFELEAFKEQLSRMGDSTAILSESDKVRIHIHTKTPEEVFAFCHRFGEFLSLKVENMTVQHTETIKNIVSSNTKNDGVFSVVAVASDKNVQQMFLEMGADVVIYSENGATTKDFVDAFENVSTKNIIVFPNNSDSVLTAIQAKNVYNKAKVFVLNTKDIVECYASLPIIDFAEENIENVLRVINETIDNLYVLNVTKRKTPVVENCNGSRSDEFFAFNGKNVIAVGNNIEDIAVNSINKILNEYDKEIITIFYNEKLYINEIESILSRIDQLGICSEIYTIPVVDASFGMKLSFE